MLHFSASGMMSYIWLIKMWMFKICSIFDSVHGGTRHLCLSVCIIHMCKHGIPFLYIIYYIYAYWMHSLMYVLMNAKICAHWVESLGLISVFLLILCVNFLQMKTEELPSLTRIARQFAAGIIRLAHPTLDSEGIN